MNKFSPDVHYMFRWLGIVSACVKVTLTEEFNHQNIHLKVCVRTNQCQTLEVTTEKWIKMSNICVVGQSYLRWEAAGIRETLTITGCLKASAGRQSPSSGHQRALHSVFSSCVCFFYSTNNIYILISQL